MTGEKTFSTKENEKMEVGCDSLPKGQQKKKKRTFFLPKPAPIGKKKTLAEQKK